MTNSLSTFASKLVAKNHFIKASFGGFAGSGKTRTMALFVAGAYKQMKCTKPVLIVDNEKGSRFLVPFFQQQGIEVLVKETSSLPDVLASMQFLKDGEIDFLMVDTLSKVWYRYVSDYKEKNRKTFMQLDDWGKILPAWQQEFSDRFVELAGNMVFSGRGGFSYEKEEDATDSDGKVTKKGSFVKSGVKMKLAGETPFEPDLNVWMELQEEVGKKGKLSVWREAHVMKDRSAIIDGKVFKNPTYKEFKPVVDFLLSVGTGPVAGETDNTNLAPSEDFGWQKRRDDRDIEVEKIKAVFDKLAIGTSKEDKQLKVVVLEKFFGSSSATEIEKMDAERLRFGRINLQRLADSFKKVQPEERLTAVESFDLEADPDLPFATKPHNGNGNEKTVEVSSPTK
jgi:hypothetical protein